MQTGNELISRSLEQKKELWEKEQLQKFADSGKEPKNDSWKNKYKGVAQIDSETHEVPDDWGWASAEAICASVRDGTHDTPKYVEEGIPLITSKNLINGKLDYSKIQMISENDHEEISKRSGVGDGDILYAMIGTIGNPVVVKKTSEFSIKNVGLFKKNEEFIKPNYLKYWLDSPQFNNWLKPRLKGTTQKFAPLGLLRSLPVPVAPPEQQKRIVAKIEELFSHIDAGIEALKKAKQLLKQYRQSVLKAAVTGELTKEWRKANKENNSNDWLKRINLNRKELIEKKEITKPKKTAEIVEDEVPYKIPGSWQWARLDDFVLTSVDCPHSTAKYKEQGKKCVRTSDFLPGKLVLDKVRYVTEEEFVERNKRLVPQANDVLYSREGGILGIACMIPDEEEVCLGQRMMIFRTESKIASTYLMHNLNSPMIVNRVKSLISGSASPHLNVGEIRNFLLPIPSKVECKFLLSMLDEKLATIVRLEQEMDLQLVKSEKNKQSILASAFSGNAI